MAVMPRSFESVSWAGFSRSYTTVVHISSTVAKSEPMRRNPGNVRGDANDIQPVKDLIQDLSTRFFIWEFRVHDAGPRVVNILNRPFWSIEGLDQNAY